MQRKAPPAKTLPPKLQRKVLTAQKSMAHIQPMTCEDLVAEVWRFTEENGDVLRENAAQKGKMLRKVKTNGSCGSNTTQRAFGTQVVGPPNSTCGDCSIRVVLEECHAPMRFWCRWRRCCAAFLVPRLHHCPLADALGEVDELMQGEGGQWRYHLCCLCHCWSSSCESGTF